MPSPTLGPVLMSGHHPGFWSLVGEWMCLAAEELETGRYLSFFLHMEETMLSCFMACYFDVG